MKIHTDNYTMKVAFDKINDTLSYYKTHTCVDKDMLVGDIQYILRELDTIVENLYEQTKD